FIVFLLTFNSKVSHFAIYSIIFPDVNPPNHDNHSLYIYDNGMLEDVTRKLLPLFSVPHLRLALVYEWRSTKNVNSKSRRIYKLIESGHNRTSGVPTY
ncbi:MAG: hypothetical protein CL753_01920, partial [Chloroflexi bacterium]|nr:hypothetical protein [Chloroflexota bacterium]